MESNKPLSGTSFKALPNPLYLVQRLVVQQRLRSWVSAALAALIRLRRGTFSCTAPVTALYREALRDLSRFGLAPLRAAFGPQQLDEIHAYLKDKTLVGDGDDAVRFQLDAAPAGVTIADYLRADTLSCPHVLELANHPELLQLAASYLGCKPTISALLLRWSFPANAPANPPADAPGTGLQAFHRDADDWRCVTLFVYLTDVDRRAGPHVYVRGSHHTAGKMRQKPLTDDAVERRFGPDRLAVVTGPAGFGFLTDPYGVHKGMVPRDRPRLILQIQYSLLPVYACDYAPEPYRGPLALDPYVNRLMLRLPVDAPPGQRGHPA